MPWAFYLAAGRVDLRPDELQTAILIPRESYENCFGHYIKYAMRNAMDIATTGCSVNVVLSEDRMMGSLVIWLKLVREPMRMAPCSSRLTPLISSMP